MGVDDTEVFFVILQPSPFQIESAFVFDDLREQGPLPQHPQQDRGQQLVQRQRLEGTQTEKGAFAAQSGMENASRGFNLI